MIQVELVSFHGVQQKVEALLPSGSGIGGSDALHGGDTTKEGGFAVESGGSVQIGQSRVTRDLLFVRQLGLD